MNCECDLRTKLVGDGCHVCHPKMAAEIAEDNRKDMLVLLRRLEWSGTYSYCTGWPCCPICKGIKHGHGKDRDTGEIPDNTGHRSTCELGRALCTEIER